ncbi:MAG: hypothetical protein QXR42_07895 [Candidatus Bathyarchaeia archaeon]
MVLPVKVFEIKETVDFGLMVQKLKNFREEEPFETESGQQVSLVTEILDLKVEGEVVSGVFSRDYVGARFYRRELVQTVGTEEAPFWIVPYNKRLFLIVLAPSVARGVKKLLTGTVANKISQILFIQVGVVVEVNIPSETLRELHEANPAATKLIWFDNVDIPGVEKLCLAGSDVADTALYKDYLSHGQIWYVVFEAQRRGIVVGVTRNCTVTLFSKSTIGELIQYIQQDILKLIK